MIAETGLEELLSTDCGTPGALKVKLGKTFLAHVHQKRLTSGALKRKPSNSNAPGVSGRQFSTVRCE